MTAAQSINISELSLDEKLGQMLMLRVKEESTKPLDLKPGSIFLFNLNTEEEYKNTINYYQNNSKIKLLVATDLEGYWSPFSFAPTKTLAQINNKEEARQLGKQHAQILTEIGFNIDFSPIAESKNTVWPGRSFTGTHEEIKQKIQAYIKAMQQNNILATAKHYPGGSMLKDPHKWKVRYEVTKDDLDLFKAAIDTNVSAIMMGHPITTGEIDSKGKQATVSYEVISHLRKDFKGLIVTDAINMWGLKWSYLLNYGQLYIDLVKAGNDIILDFSKPFWVKRRLSTLKKAIEKGEIPMSRIDQSVGRILRAKGYNIIT